MSVENEIADMLLALEAAWGFRTAYEASATGIKALTDAVVAGVASDPDGQFVATVRRVPPLQVAGGYSAWRDALGVKLRHVALQLDRADLPPNSDIRLLLAGLRKYMQDNSKAFKSRGVTNSAPSVVAGTGTGSLVMLSSDENGVELEDVFAETIRFECVSDKTTGRSSGSELFRARGELVGSDALASGGSGANDASFVSSWAEQLTTLANATFGQESVADATFNASASSTKIAAWTITGTPTDVVKNSATSLFRTLVSGTTNRIGFSGAAGIEQNFSYQADAPVIVAVPVNPTIDSASGGNVVLTAGAVNTTAALSSLSPGWQWIVRRGWPKQLRAGGAAQKVKVEWSSPSSGTLWIGPVVMAPMRYVGGKWFAILPGSTDFIVGDYFTQTTTIAGTGKAKHALHQIFSDLRFELPHAGTASTGYEDWS